MAPAESAESGSWETVPLHAAEVDDAVDRAERLEVGCFDDRFVTAVVVVRLVVGDEATLLGLVLVGAFRGQVGHDEDASGLAVADELAGREAMRLTELRATFGDRDERPVAADGTDGAAFAGRRDPTFVDLDGDTAEMFTAGVPNRVVRAGARAVVEVDDVGPVFGLDDVPVVSEGSDHHRFGSRAECATGEAVGWKGPRCVRGGRMR
jgi:hypothetical protein